MQTFVFLWNRTPAAALNPHPCKPDERRFTMMQKLRALFGFSFKDEKRPPRAGEGEAPRDPAKEPGQPPAEADRGNPPRHESAEQTRTQDESPGRTGRP